MNKKLRIKYFFFLFGIIQSTTLFTMPSKTKSKHPKGSQCSSDDRYKPKYKDEKKKRKELEKALATCEAELEKFKELARQYKSELEEERKRKMKKTTPPAASTDEDSSDSSSEDDSSSSEDEEPRTHRKRSCGRHTRGQFRKEAADDQHQHDTEGQEHMKKKKCRFWNGKPGSCRAGDRCQFAHVDPHKEAKGGSGPGPGPSQRRGQRQGGPRPRRGQGQGGSKTRREKPRSSSC